MLLGLASEIRIDALDTCLAEKQLCRLVTAGARALSSPVRTGPSTFMSLQSESWSKETESRAVAKVCDRQEVALGKALRGGRLLLSQQNQTIQIYFS